MAYSKWKRSFQAELPKNFWRSLKKNCDLDRVTHFLFYVLGESGTRTFTEMAELKRKPAQRRKAMSAARKQFKKTTVAIERLRSFIGESSNLEGLKRALAQRPNSLPNSAMSLPEQGPEEPSRVFPLEALICELRAWDRFLERIISSTMPLPARLQRTRLRPDKLKVAIAACEIQKCVCDFHQENMYLHITQVLNAALAAHGLGSITEDAVRLSITRHPEWLKGEAYSKRPSRQ